MKIVQNLPQRVIYSDFSFSKKRCFEQFRSHVKSIIKLLSVTRWTTGPSMNPSISRDKVLRRWVPCSANHLTLLIMGKGNKTRLWGYQRAQQTHIPKDYAKLGEQILIESEASYTHTPQNEKNWDNLRYLNPPPNFAFRWDIHVWSSPTNHPRQASTRNCYENLDEDLVLATVGTPAILNAQMYVCKFH